MTYTKMVEEYIANNQWLTASERAIVRGTTNGGNWILCADGYSFSMLGQKDACCISAIAPGQFTAMEVGFFTSRPEPWTSWEAYFTGGDNDVAEYVPVRMIRDLITLHGGDVTPYGYSRKLY